jgi:hypothetical protein
MEGLNTEKASRDKCIPVDWDKCVLKWTRNLCGGVVNGHVSEQIFLICIYISAMSLFPVQSTVELNQALNTSIFPLHSLKMIGRFMTREIGHGVARALTRYG